MPDVECRRSASLMHAVRYGSDLTSSYSKTPDMPRGANVASSSSRSFLYACGFETM